MARLIQGGREPPALYYEDVPITRAYWGADLAWINTWNSFTVAVQSSFVASLAIERNFAVSITAQSVFSAKLAIERNFAATIPVTSGFSAKLAIERNMAVAIPVMSVFSAKLAIERNLAATIPVISEFAASLAIERNFAVSIPVQSEMTASLQVERRLSVVIPVASTFAAALAIERNLAVTIPVGSSFAATLSVGFSAYDRLAGGDGLSILGTSSTVLVAVEDTSTPANDLVDVDINDAASPLAISSASAKVVPRASGVWVTQPATEIPFAYSAVSGCCGIASEPIATNESLYGSDFTQAAVWSATDMTPVKTATGADGVANSASTLTATADNGTILQSITGTSAGRLASCMAKRRTGTGTIYMTQDGGTTWTDVTSQIGVSWGRAYVPKATITNPQVGFKIATSGDAIDVMWFGIEKNVDYPTSPIPTMASQVTRAGGVIKIPASAFPSASPISIIADFVPNTVGAYSGIFSLESANVQDRIASFVVINGGDRVDVVTGGAAQASKTITGVGAGVLHKFGVRVDTDDFATVLNGGTPQTDNSVTLPAAPAYLQIGGNYGAVSQNLHGIISSLLVVPPKTDAQLQTLTS